MYATVAVQFKYHNVYLRSSCFVCGGGTNKHSAELTLEHIQSPKSPAGSCSVVGGSYKAMVLCVNINSVECLLVSPHPKQSDLF